MTTELVAVVLATVQLQQVIAANEGQNKQQSPNCHNIEVIKSSGLGSGTSMQC